MIKNNKRKGISVISYVILAAIVVISVILVMTVINPILDESKEMESYNEGLQIMRAINKAVKEVMFESPGTRRVIDLSLREGELDVVGSENKIKFVLENIEYFSPGNSQEGNIIVRSGSWMDAKESDIDNDGQTELVLENDAVVFATKKLGSSSSPVAVNTTNFIKLIRNIRADADIRNPVTAIYINDDPLTAYGTGYTELTQPGLNLPSSGIRLYIVSTGGKTYEAIFALAAASDFIEMNVRIVS